MEKKETKEEEEEKKEEREKKGETRWNTGTALARIKHATTLP